MNISEIKADVDFLCGSTSATYADTNKLRNINIAYQDVARVIWESDGVWKFDEKSNTDTPLAYQSLGNLSAEYVIPTTALAINGIEIKNAEGNWAKLKYLNPDELFLSREEYMTGGGMPLYYELNGNTIRLYPAPTSGYATLSSGMMVRLARNVNTVTAATAEPGFIAPFHRILSLAAAIDFEQDKNHREFLVVQKSRLENGLIKFYSHRADEIKTQIKPSMKKRWRGYI